MKRKTSRQFAALPNEKQESIHASLTDLFTQLEAEWRAKPITRGSLSATGRCGWSLLVGWDE